MAAEHPGTDPRLQAWVAVVVYYWQREGVSDQDRIRLRADLDHDLGQSLAEGASIDDLIAADPGEFAREVAEADGILTGPLRPHHEMTTRSFIGTALAGAVGGAFVAAIVVYPFGLYILDQLQLSLAGERTFALCLHVIAACLCTASAMLAVWWRFRFQNGLHRVVALTGIFLILGGAASVLPTIALAASIGYSTRALPVLVEIVIVVGFCIAGLRMAVWVANRDDKPARIA